MKNLTIMFGIIILLFLQFGCVGNENKKSKTHEKVVSIQSTCRCEPDQPCWPKQEDWRDLNQSVQGRLVQVKSPVQSCKTNSQSKNCADNLKKMQNPFFIEDQPGATQSTGWLGAWKTAVSPYAVVPESTQDIVAAVNFARKHNLKLVIKGTGHDYLGRSNASNSLLVWTHKMRRVTMHESFVLTGCPSTKPGMPAVTAQAGARWLEAYNEVTTKHGRYVQGGGCTSVGVAGGFTQGGGFGSFSKKFGTGAAGMLELEVVTAGGKVLIANECQNKDIFWALRGGGGGTFGVVTKMTLKAHELPKLFGVLEGKITASSDDAFKELLFYFFKFYLEKLNNEHWGEQVTVSNDNSLSLFLLFQGLTKTEAENVWLPFKSWIAKRPELFTISTSYIVLPARNMWDYNYWKQHHPKFVQRDKREGQPNYQYWWAPNSGEVSEFWYTYQSRWLPLNLFEEKYAKHLVKTMFDASRHWHVALHFNKGLAGASQDAIKRGRETSTNPAVYDAAALVIMSAGKKNVFPGVKGYEPNQDDGQNQARLVSAGMKIITDATPDSGAYVNEADYFQKNWQHAFWGKNYSKLLKIKQKYDPDGFFYCHHCVGSEAWTKNGMCKK